MDGQGSTPCSSRAAPDSSRTTPGSSRATPDSSREPELWVCDVGTVAYREGLALQEAVRTARQGEELPDTLLLLEHPPVYTRGRRSLDGELSLGEDFYRARGIEVVDTNRGGRVTYHGPGQLVGYPVMRVSDVGAHLRTMEAAIAAALEDEGVQARTRCAEGPDYTGVWVAERKIASIGVHVSRGVSTHGFAVNVTNDLEPFEWIVPCGLSGVEMTSVGRELARIGREVDPERFKQLLIEHFGEVRDRRAIEVDPDRLGLAMAVAA